MAQDPTGRPAKRTELPWRAIFVALAVVVIIVVGVVVTVLRLHHSPTSTPASVTDGHPQFSVTDVSARGTGHGNIYSPNFYVLNGDQYGPDWALITLNIGGRFEPFGPTANVDCAAASGGQKCLLYHVPGGTLFISTVSGKIGTPIKVTVQLVRPGSQVGPVVATAHGTLGH